MIEGALLYILAAVPPNGFVGCGAVIEGGLIATCRHVLVKAADCAAPRVAFPGAHADLRHHALTLAASCEDEAEVPDLVLLRAAAFPPGTPVLQLAMGRPSRPATPSPARASCATGSAGRRPRSRDASTAPSIPTTAGDSSPARRGTGTGSCAPPPACPVDAWMPKEIGRRLRAAQQASEQE